MRQRIPTSLMPTAPMAATIASAACLAPAERARTGPRFSGLAVKQAHIAHPAPVETRARPRR